MKILWKLNLENYEEGDMLDLCEAKIKGIS